MSNTAKGKHAGAPRNNRNAMRHGLSAGNLPSDARYIENRMNAFRRQLEDLVLAAKGQVTLMDAALIQTVLKHERHGMLAQRWLRLEEKKLKPLERLNFSREITKAAERRDKALLQLKLDRDVIKDQWKAIDAFEVSPHDLEDK